MERRYKRRSDWLPSKQNAEVPNLALGPERQVYARIWAGKFRELPWVQCAFFVVVFTLYAGLVSLWIGLLLRNGQLSGLLVAMCVGGAGLIGFFLLLRRFVH
jgi:hypothetical protein